MIYFYFVFTLYLSLIGLHAFMKAAQSSRVTYPPTKKLTMEHIQVPVQVFKHELFIQDDETMRHPMFKEYQDREFKRFERILLEELMLQVSACVEIKGVYDFMGRGWTVQASVSVANKNRLPRPPLPFLIDLWKRRESTGEDC